MNAIEEAKKIQKEIEELKKKTRILEAKPAKEKVDNLILKISLKKTSWEFIKNHMQKSDAEELFFDDYNSVIKNYIENSYDLLKDLPVVDLGYDGEIINKKEKITCVEEKKPNFLVSAMTGESSGIFFQYFFGTIFFIIENL